MHFTGLCVSPLCHYQHSVEIYYVLFDNDATPTYCFYFILFYSLRTGHAKHGISPQTGKMPVCCSWLVKIGYKPNYRKQLKFGVCHVDTDCLISFHTKFTCCLHLVDQACLACSGSLAVST